MMDTFTFQTIAETSTAEYNDRGSKFVGLALPVNNSTECKARIKEIKLQHEKANHHCYAYRLGADGLIFRSSDNGEPSGTAGRPILGQINHFELTNILVVVVRYFGGTLLGIRGLIDAYKEATTRTLEVAPKVIRSIEERYRLHFDYTGMNAVMRIIKQHQCSILKQEVQLFCMMEIGIPLQVHDECLALLKNIPQLEYAIIR